MDNNKNKKYIQRLEQAHKKLSVPIKEIECHMNQREETDEIDIYNRNREKLIQLADHNQMDLNQEIIDQAVKESLSELIKSTTKK